MTWLWCVNRDLLLPPGLDDQWLVSIMHSDADLATHVEVFAALAEALR